MEGIENLLTAVLILKLKVNRNSEGPGLHIAPMPL